MALSETDALVLPAPRQQGELSLEAALLRRRSVRSFEPAALGEEGKKQP